MQADGTPSMPGGVTHARDEVAEKLAERRYMGFNANELRAIWLTMGDVILAEMFRGRAVDVGPFGVFTFTEERIEMGVQKAIVVRKPCFVMNLTFAKNNSIMPISKPPVPGLKAHPLSYGQIAIIAPSKVKGQRTNAKCNRNTVFLVLSQYFNIIGRRCKSGIPMEMPFGALGTFIFGTNGTKSSYFLFSEELIAKFSMKGIRQSPRSGQHSYRGSRGSSTNPSPRSYGTPRPNPPSTPTPKVRRDSKGGFARENASRNGSRSSARLPSKEGEYSALPVRTGYRGGASSTVSTDSSPGIGRTTPLPSMSSNNYSPSGLGYPHSNSSSYSQYDGKTGPYSPRSRSAYGFRTTDPYSEQSKRTERQNNVNSQLQSNGGYAGYASPEAPNRDFGSGASTPKMPSSQNYQYDIPMSRDEIRTSNETTSAAGSPKIYPSITEASGKLVSHSLPSSPVGDRYSNPNDYIYRDERRLDALANSMTYKKSTLEKAYQDNRSPYIPNDGTPNRSRIAAFDWYDNLYNKYFTEEMQTIQTQNVPLETWSQKKHVRPTLGSARQRTRNAGNPYYPDGGARARSMSSTGIRNNLGFRSSDPEFLKYAEFLREHVKSLKQAEDEKMRERSRIASAEATYNMNIADEQYNRKLSARTSGIRDLGLEPMTNIFEEAEIRQLEASNKSNTEYSKNLIDQMNEIAAQRRSAKQEELMEERRENQEIINSIREDNKRAIARNEATRRTFSEMYSKQVEDKMKLEQTTRKEGHYMSVFSDKEGRGPLKWRTAPESREFHRRQAENLRQIMNEETRKLQVKKEREEREKEMLKLYKTDVLSELKREEESGREVTRMMQATYGESLKDQMLEPRNCDCPKKYGNSYIPFAEEEKNLEPGDMSPSEYRGKKHFSA